MIVSFSGKKGSGKDTAAKALYSRGFKKVSFAEPIKEITAKFFHISREDLEKHKDKPFGDCLTLNAIFISVLMEYIGEIQEVDDETAELVLLFGVGKKIHSMREFMQFVGTDLARDIIDQDIWVNYALRNVPELAVFTDVRFPNELEAMQKYEADCLYIGKPGANTGDTHESENSITGTETGLTVIENNGTIEQLHKNVLAALNLE